MGEVHNLEDHRVAVEAVTDGGYVSRDPDFHWGRLFIQNRIGVVLTIAAPDAERLDESDYRDAIADAVAEGVRKYLREREGGGGGDPGSAA